MITPRLVSLRAVSFGRAQDLEENHHRVHDAVEVVDVVDPRADRQPAVKLDPEDAVDQDEDAEQAPAADTC